MVNIEGYTGGAAKTLVEAGANVGDKIRLSVEGRVVVGRLMPRVGSSSDILTIKLDNGYNIGVKSSKCKIEAVYPGSPSEHTSVRGETQKAGLIRGDGYVSLVSTGGTIASRVEYETGAVKPALSASELIQMVPELDEYARVRTRVLMSILSENMRPALWSEIAHAVYEEVGGGSDGVVVATGTDTMGYTAAALSFALKGVGVPIVLVGAQRSSDRPSSDAYTNLVNAVSFAKSGAARGVFVCMHSGVSDGESMVIEGVRVRKLHTSMRSAFQPVNAAPYAFVSGKSISYVHPPGTRGVDELDFKPNFSEDVSLIYFYPGVTPRKIRSMAEGSKGVVIGGTGLGHVASDLTDTLSELIRSGCHVFMTSQCLWGRVNMNVYTTGRRLLEVGVVPLEDMLMETAYVKLSWAVANFEWEKVPSVMRSNLVGEISERSVLTTQVHRSEGWT